MIILDLGLSFLNITITRAYRPLNFFLVIHYWLPNLNWRFSYITSLVVWAVKFYFPSIIAKSLIISRLAVDSLTIIDGNSNSPVINHTCLFFKSCWLRMFRFLITFFYLIISWTLLIFYLNDSRIEYLFSNGHCLWFFEVQMPFFSNLRNVWFTNTFCLLRHFEMTCSCRSLGTSLRFTKWLNGVIFQSNILRILKYYWINWEGLSLRRQFIPWILSLYRLDLNNIRYLFLFFHFLVIILIFYKNRSSKWYISPWYPICPVSSKANLAIRTHFWNNCCHYTFICN